MIGKKLWRLMNYMTTRAEHRETIKMLNRRRDKELKDIGVNRADIDRMVRLKEDKSVRGRGL